MNLLNKNVLSLIHKGQKLFDYTNTNFISNQKFILIFIIILLNKT